MEVIRRLLATSRSRSISASSPTVRDADGLALSSRNALLVAARSAQLALALPRRARDEGSRRGHERSSTASTSTTSRMPRSIRPVLAAAVRVGAVRLIDNVVLDEEEAHEHQAA